jgi:hypothetical protein
MGSGAWHGWKPSLIVGDWALAGKNDSATELHVAAKAVKESLNCLFTIAVIHLDPLARRVENFNFFHGVTLVVDCLN